MRPLLRPLLSVLLCAAATGASAQAPAVVASIAPVHSLVAAVMAGVGEPTLLLPPGASPHAFAFKPSQAGALADAAVVFRVGEELETFLERPLRGLAANARVVDLAEAPGVRRLSARAAGPDHHADEHGHEHGHDHGNLDPHMWLDPANARAWARTIAEVLAEVDPAHADTYAANTAELDRRLAGLAAALERDLRPVTDVPFVVFHDGYQYFERRFGLRAVGAVAVDPERPPGIRSLAAIRERIREAGAVCVFAEPQFEPALVRTVVEGSGARIGTLDPLGAGLEPGPELYPSLMRRLAADLKRCLSGS